MELKGVEARAKDARAALNRLHHEVQAEIYFFQAGEPSTNGGIERGLDEIVEATAVLANVIDKIAPHLNDEQKARVKAKGEFYASYHRVAR